MKPQPKPDFNRTSSRMGIFRLFSDAAKDTSKGDFNMARGELQSFVTHLDQLADSLMALSTITQKHMKDFERLTDIDPLVAAFDEIMARRHLPAKLRASIAFALEEHWNGIVEHELTLRSAHPLTLKTGHGHGR